MIGAIFTDFQPVTAINLRDQSDIHNTNLVLTLAGPQSFHEEIFRALLGDMAAKRLSVLL